MYHSEAAKAVKQKSRRCLGIFHNSESCDNCFGKCVCCNCVVTRDAGIEVNCMCFHDKCKADIDKVIPGEFDALLKHVRTLDRDGQYVGEGANFVINLYHVRAHIGDLKEKGITGSTAECSYCFQPIIHQEVNGQRTVTNYDGKAYHHDPTRGINCFRHAKNAHYEGKAYTDTLRKLINVGLSVEDARQIISQLKYCKQPYCRQFSADNNTVLITAISRRINKSSWCVIDNHCECDFARECSDGYESGFGTDDESDGNESDGNEPDN